MAHKVVDNGDRSRGFMVVGQPDLTVGALAR